MTISVVDMPVDQQIRHTLAQWSLDEWNRDFPADTIDWYLNLYDEAERTDTLPIVLAAFVDGEVAGTASVITDDELPDATEPGPWLAAVFVAPQFRGQGVGTALATEAVERARAMEHVDIYLYTRSRMSMYERLGFTVLRQSQLGDHAVTVMVNKF
jgi:GNAT superfamily N-acetyltransferase